MNKQDVVNALLAGKAWQARQQGVSVFSPANIALIKYWGKRNQSLNLPNTSSLSVSLGHLGAMVSIAIAETDSLQLNNKFVPASNPVAIRLFEFLDLFRSEKQYCFSVRSDSNIPLAAGLASSASGFSAMVKALDALFAWHLSSKALSILARLGSGSACRSIEPGFCLWKQGEHDDGMDSYATRLETVWSDLCIGLLIVNGQTKKISSREAMQRTVETSPLYSGWPAVVAKDLAMIQAALAEKNFMQLGSIAESNAEAMHATMASADPAIIYSQAETMTMMQQVRDARSAGLLVYFTQDAGPNLKLLFLSKDEADIKQLFPGVEIVKPFSEVS